MVFSYIRLLNLGRSPARFEFALWGPNFITRISCFSLSLLNININGSSFKTAPSSLYSCSAQWFRLETHILTAAVCDADGWIIFEWISPHARDKIYYWAYFWINTSLITGLPQKFTTHHHTTFYYGSCISSFPTAVWHLCVGAILIICNYRHWWIDSTKGSTTGKVPHSENELAIIHFATYLPYLNFTIHSNFNKMGL
jgi:hypothetical protein